MRMLLLAPILLLATGSVAAASVGDVLTGPAGGWLLFGVAVAALMVFAALCRKASVYLGERAHASRVSRLMDVLASQADGIAGLLLAHPPAAGATLATVREAAIAQSVAYVKANLPDTLVAIGVTDGVLAARLGNAVAGKLVDSVPAAAVQLGLDVVAPRLAAAPAA